MDECRAVLRGEIDVANAAEVINRVWGVATGGDGEVVVDCLDLTFIDVATVEALLRVQRDLVDEGRDLRLAHPSPMLIRILQILDLTQLLRPIRA